ncbi:MAG: tetratricopeptide repeat protein [Anaerolineae bacterium]|nr:tetratricopeptide repeat protein [Anaerolineae bacterium]
MIELTLLGPPSITLEGKPVDGFISSKALILFCYLALESERTHAREELASLLWGDMPDGRAKANLSQALHNIQKLLPDYLTVTRKTAAFDATQPHQADVNAFQDMLKGTELDATELEQAVALYQGEFLAGICIDGAPELESWMWRERECCRQLYFSALERLAEHHALLGHWERAAELTRRLLDIEPWHEGSHRHLMLLLARQGKYDTALAQYDACCRVLDEELDTAPALETTALYERIQNAAETERHNVPPALGTFVGRQAEMQSLAEYIGDPACRLVTLVGPGGIGKTRLAQELVVRQASRFLDGIIYVPLIPVTRPELIATAIADAANIPITGAAPPREQLIAHLAERESLLLLDGFEHLVAGVDIVPAILHAAPQTKIIVTSRVKLDLRDEWVFAVDGLSVPPEEVGEAGQIEEYEAVEHFVHCARRHKSDFTLHSQEAAVARLCRILGGLPLGIELATGLLSVASCSQIADEVEQNLDVLASTRRDALERHRSLRAVFDHSWQMLSVNEQQVFPRLSVFLGGFTPEAASDVAGADLQVLNGLVSKSLLRAVSVEDGAAVRYEIHENLRQYAQEKLEGEPEVWQQTVADYAAFYADFMERQHARWLQGETQAIDAMSCELGNVRAAWRRAVENRMMGEIGQIVEPLLKLCEARGWFPEGSDLLALALAELKPEATPDDQLVWGRLLAHRATYQMNLGTMREAQQSAQQGVDVLRRCNAEEHLARALNKLGAIQASQGDHVSAKESFRESLSIFRAVGNWQGSFAPMIGLGITCICSGDYETAREALEEGLALCYEKGLSHGVAHCLANLGQLYRTMGDLSVANRYYEQALPACAEDALKVVILLNLGELHVRRGEFEQALDDCRTAMAIVQRFDMLGVINGLMCLSLAHHGLGDEASARRCLCEGLEAAIQRQVSPTILYYLIGGAVLLWDSGSKEEGVDLLTLVARHPMTDHGDRLFALEVLAERGIDLPDDAPCDEERPVAEVASVLLAKLGMASPASDVPGEPAPTSGARHDATQANLSCPNEACELFGDVEAAQIIRFGKTGSGTQRYRCQSCGQTFTETRGTVFYRRQAPHETILETLALLAKGGRIGGVARIKGVKEDTILDWLRSAAEQAETIEETLLRDYRLNREQIERLWSYVDEQEAP